MNSPNNFVLADNRARSSKKPITKIPIEPRIIDPITGFIPVKDSLSCGTETPATEITMKKEIRIAAPPSLGVACLWTFYVLSAGSPQTLSVKQESGLSV